MFSTDASGLMARRYDAAQSFATPQSRGRPRPAPLRGSPERRTEVMSTDRLPAGFESVEPLVAAWVLPDSNARAAKRQGSTLVELQSFYDAMLPIARPAVAYLRDHTLEDLPPEGSRLLKLMLSLDRK